MSDLETKNDSDPLNDQQSAPSQHPVNNAEQQQCSPPSQHSVNNAQQQQCSSPFQQIGYDQNFQHQYQQPSYIPPNYNPYQQAPSNDQRGMAIAAMILGIISLIPCIPFICSILAIVFGCMGFKSSGKGMAIAGIVCGSVGIVFQIIFFFGYTILNLSTYWH